MPRGVRVVPAPAGDAPQLEITGDDRNRMFLLAGGSSWVRIDADRGASDGVGDGVFGGGGAPSTTRRWPQFWQRVMSSVTGCEQKGQRASSAAVIVGVSYNSRRRVSADGRRQSGRSIDTSKGAPPGTDAPSRHRHGG